MYPTRWVFFKPLPICFSPSSPLSKLPTKTTNVGSKLASLKKSATMDLGSHQVFKGPQGFHGGLTHVALTPPHRFWPNIFPTSNEGNRGNKRMNSPPTLISTVLHNWPSISTSLLEELFPRNLTGLRHLKNLLFTLFVSFNLELHLLETHPDAGHVKSLFCQFNILQHSRFLWPPGYHQPSTG